MIDFHAINDVPTKYGLRPTHVENIQKFIEYLKTHDSPEFNFDIKKFMPRLQERYELLESWEEYCRTHFGMSPNKMNRKAWFFCLGPYWTNSNNTPKGTAARIAYFLEHGVPEAFGYNRDVYYHELDLKRYPQPWLEELKND